MNPEKMKNSLLLLTAFAVSFLTGCAGPAEVEDDSCHDFTFSCSQIELKTEFDGSFKSTIWDSFDTKDRFRVYENGVQGSVSDVRINDGILGLTVSFPGSKPSVATFTALYSSSGNSSEEAVVPSVQYPRRYCFDPAAEVLVAQPLTISGQSRPEELCFKFARAAAAIRMNLKDLENGETVEKVRIKAEPSCIAGCLDIAYNGKNVSVGTAGDKDLYDAVTLFYSKDNTVGNDGVFESWFTALPSSITKLDFEVTTDRYIYTASASGLNMKWTTGRISTFGLPLSKAEKTPVKKEYTLVTDISQLSSGDEVVIACNSQGMVATDISNDVLGNVEAGFSSDKSAITSLPDAALRLTLSGNASGWEFINEKDLKLGCTAVKKLAWSSGETKWTISKASTGQIEIKSSTSSYGKLQYNAQSPRFTTYTSSQKPVQLYRISGSSTPREPVALVMGNVECSGCTQTSLTFSWAEVSHSAGYSVSFDYGTPFTTDKTSYTAGGLGAGTTHTISVRALGDGVYYLDSAPSATSATTLKEGGQVSEACRGWFELPAQKDADRNGIDDGNSDYYYSWTMRADATKIRNFSSCYSKKYKHPVWVAAPLHKCYLGSSGRNDSYKPDPAISCAQSSSFSGYTRGHMVSSSERTVSKATNRQAFYYSNIGAQMSSGFNTGGGAWNNLEDFVDNNLVCSDTLYQVVGCIFETFKDKYGGTVSKKSGDGFQVPTAWYKALLRTKKGNTGKKVDNCSADELMCVAFILPHKSNKGHKPTANDMYSISELEELTGLTFFVNVPNAPKDSYKTSDWGL